MTSLLCFLFSSCERGTKKNGKNRPPVISSIEVTPGTSVNIGATVTLTCNATDSDGDALTYTWIATGGTLSTTTGTTVNWTAPSTAGTYTITVKVSDGKGGEVTGSKNMTVTSPGLTNQPPTATLTASPTSGTAPLTVTFTIGYTDPEGKAGTYSLNPGDGSPTKTGSINSGATIKVSHTYTKVGTYTAVLTVTDNQGATGKASKTITVSNIIKTTQKISAGEKHTCAVLSDGTIKCWGYNYYGQIGDGTNTSSNTPVSAHNSLYTFFKRFYFFAKSLINEKKAK